MYFINGYRFQTESHSASRKTSNSGVCITTGDMEYYGVITDIFEVEYPMFPVKKCTIFKCRWFDPTPGVGINVNENYNIVEVNTRKSWNTSEPYILAQQASQVAYISYPGAVGQRADWVVAITIRPRGWMSSKNQVVDHDALQEDVDEPVLVEPSSIAEMETVRSVIEETISDDEDPEAIIDPVMDSSSDEHDDSSDSDYGSTL